MLKMLIVEDEWLEREGLVNFLDWNSLGIEDPEIACDGIEGIEKARYIRPDIIITDIKMPGMDGLKMSSKIREFLPDVKIIILTGYDDFKLAKEAIDINANAYILKPVEEDEMLTVLERMLNECREDRKKQEEKRMLKELIDGNIAATRRELVLAMLAGNITDEVLNQILDMNIVSYYGKYTVIAADLYAGGRTGRPGDGLLDPNKMDAELMRDISNCGTYLAAALYDAEGMALLITKQKSESEGAPEDALESAAAVIGHLSGKGYEAVAGVGLTTDCITGLHLSCRQAKEALNYGLFWKDRKVTGYLELEKIQRDGASKVADFLARGNYFTKQLMHALRAADSGRMLNLLEDLYQFINSSRWTDINIIKNYFFSLLNETHLLFQGADFSETEAGAPGEIFHIPADICSIREYVSGLFKRLLDTIQERRNNKVEYVINRVEQIISEKYSSDINIKSIANEIYLSPNYLGSVFKKCTGKSLVDYICQYRMEKAKELLQSPKSKVSQVAKDVGIPNTTYFCTLFKEMYGITPGEYQEILLQSRK